MTAMNMREAARTIESLRTLSTISAEQVRTLLGDRPGWSYYTWRLCMQWLGLEPSLEDPSASLISSLPLDVLAEWSGRCGLLPEMIRSISVHTKTASIDTCDWWRFRNVDSLHIMEAWGLLKRDLLDRSLTWMEELQIHELKAPYISEHRIFTEPSALQQTLTSVEINGRMLPFMGNLENLNTLSLIPRGLVLRLDVLPTMLKLENITIRCDYSGMTHDELAWLINVLWASAPNLERVWVKVGRGDKDLQQDRLLHLLDMVGLLDGGLHVELCEKDT